MDDYLYTLPVKALPGIGHVLEEKLKNKQIRTCGQLRPIAKVIFTVIELSFFHLALFVMALSFCTHPFQTDHKGKYSEWLFFD